MLSPPYWIFAENFPKAGRIGKSFLVLLGCPSYYLGTTREKEGLVASQPLRVFGVRLLNSRLSRRLEKANFAGKLPQQRLKSVTAAYENIPNGARI